MTLIDQVLEQMKLVKESDLVQDRAIQRILDTIDATVFAGNFEIVNIELDSDGETDHVYGVIRPKNVFYLSCLGAENADLILKALADYLKKDFNDFDVPVYFSPTGYAIDFDVRIDR